MVHAAFLMLLFPLAGFVVLLAVGRRIGDPWAGWVGTAAIAGAFVTACVVLAGLLGEPASSRSFTQTYYTWIPVGGLRVPAAILVDQLSITMALFVTGVSMFIHMYSIGYMSKDRDYTKFFVYLNLFVFSMLLLVLANNLLLTFVGWEGVGVCSYWLVSFWYERDVAASAGKKAFIYNRIGDVGFLLAMFLIFSKVGTLNYETPGGGIFGHVHLLNNGSSTVVVLLLLFAAAGKSAQIPLFNWLADAMEGPTPVSALIHAATMVTAGVYLLCRMNPVLHAAPDADWVIAGIGAATALVGALIATSQQDIKKVLAFSTISQIGFMVLAVGVGAYVAAMFLMICHAFYKATLFLGAGSVIHGLEDEQDLKRMGNLRRYLPWTFAAFTVGWLAIAGVPPFSGFWSKGEVLLNVFQKSKSLWVVGFVAALLTAYYMTRLFYLAFYGDDRWAQAVGDHPAHHRPHESPWIMVVPLGVLAVGAAVAGVIDLPWVHTWGLGPWLAPVFGPDLFQAHASDAAEWLLSSGEAFVAVVGIALGLGLWRNVVDRPALEPVALQRVLYWDDAYDATLGRPGQALARFSASTVDNRVIDGAVNGVGTLVRKTGSGVRRLQTGYVRNYALGIALGLAGLVAFMVSRVWGS